MSTDYIDASLQVHSSQNPPFLEICPQTPINSVVSVSADHSAPWPQARNQSMAPTYYFIINVISDLHGVDSALLRRNVKRLPTYEASADQLVTWNGGIRQYASVIVSTEPCALGGLNRSCSYSSCADLGSKISSEIPAILLFTCSMTASMFDHDALLARCITRNVFLHLSAILLSWNRSTLSI
ncbi:hypothetical protein HYPSUDRAFT_360715 [Hypholoma sublateritium FD-334 SS-4]|uniref:Uncharacterized protein n=1 Tax=Hypholoma sublateritium (strain FD-334 SS-4) TaxID=945553 RepID=A0A0D2NFY5_HYPSF|nr:hypothetical protein HYPSUDRAFT_360715 [Hypholoma sublateritium FD-334 SS-4]